MVLKAKLIDYITELSQLHNDYVDAGDCLVETRCFYKISGVIDALRIYDFDAKILVNDRKIMKVLINGIKVFEI